MSSLVQHVGPVALAAGIAYAYHQNHTDGASFPLSTTSCVLLVGLLYVSGLTPRNPFFPEWFHRSNVFAGVYRLYCSERVGYRYLRPLMHASVPFPHSDYRAGVRALSGGGGLTAWRPPAHSAPFHFARGGGPVDLKQLPRSGAGSDALLVVPVPMFQDNYAYLIASLRTGAVAAVDPADMSMTLHVMDVLRAWSGRPFRITDVLITHKHWDHAGGTRDLKAFAEKERASGDAEPIVAAGLRVYGSATDAAMDLTDLLDADAAGAVPEPFTVCEGAAAVRALSAPGHTRGSLLFAVGAAAPAEGPQRVAVFPGDVIFSGGMGGQFELRGVDDVLRTREALLGPGVHTHPGTGAAVADEDVLLYVGHEYTERLLEGVNKSMSELERPSDAARTYGRNVFELLSAVQAARKVDGTTRTAAATASADDTKMPSEIPCCSLPTTLAIEKKVNPLLTVSRKALEALKQRSGDGTVDTNAIENVIYSSPEREFL